MKTIVILALVFIILVNAEDAIDVTQKRINRQAQSSSSLSSVDKKQDKRAVYNGYGYNDLNTDPYAGYNYLNPDYSGVNVHNNGAPYEDYSSDPYSSQYYNNQFRYRTGLNSYNPYYSKRVIGLKYGNAGYNPYNRWSGYNNYGQYDGYRGYNTGYNYGPGYSGSIY